DAPPHAPVLAAHEGAACPQVVAAQRLVEAADRVQAEQLADDEHVQRDLKATGGGPAAPRPPPPPGPRRPPGSALVVAHQRVAATVDVDAVDHPPDEDALLAVSQLQRRQRV